MEELIDRGFRYALALTHDEVQAEELLQDVWVSVLKSHSSEDPDSIFKILRERFFDLEKRERLVALEPAFLTSDDVLEFLEWTSSWPGDELIEKALGSLRPQEREVLYLAAVEGYNLTEISSLTRQPLNVISSLTKSVHGKLSSLLFGVETERHHE